MTHVNVSVPEFYETSERKHFAVLSSEMEFWKEEAERLRKELENIPRAIKQFGYVEIASRGETVVLIARDAEKTAEQYTRTEGSA